LNSSKFNFPSEFLSRLFNKASVSLSVGGVFPSCSAIPNLNLRVIQINNLQLQILINDNK